MHPVPDASSPPKRSTKSAVPEAGTPPTPEFLNHQSLPDWSLLATWVQIVQTGSLTQTAQRLGVSPAAVSQRLKHLEEKMGTELYVRAVRPLIPTAAGSEFYAHASILMQQAADLYRAMGEFHTGRREVVRIGTLEAFASTLGPDLVRGNGQTGWPGIRLSAGLASDLEWQMDRRMIDFMVTADGSVAKGSIRKDALFTEKFLVAVPRHVNLAGKDTLRALIDTLPMVRYSMRSVMGRDLDAYFKHEDEHIPRSYEFEAAGPMLGLVASGLGFAITTALCLWDVRHLLEKLQVFPLAWLRSRAGRALMPPQRILYLGYRDRESDIMRERLGALIQASAARLFEQEMATTLNLEAASLWESFRG